eukprot:12410859-Karenia_brevis.AAC.1
MQKTLTKVAGKVECMDDKIDKALMTSQEAKVQAAVAEKKSSEAQAQLQQIKADMGNLVSEGLKQTVKEVVKE